MRAYKAFSSVRRWAVHSINSPASAVVAPTKNIRFLRNPVLCLGQCSEFREWKPRWSCADSVAFGELGAPGGALCSQTGPGSQKVACFNHRGLSSRERCKIDTARARGVSTDQSVADYRQTAHHAPNQAGKRPRSSDAVLQEPE